MQFGIHDREYTAQILKRTGLHQWKVCGHTTIIVHGPISLWDSDRSAFMASLRYGAGLNRPNIKFGSHV